MRTGRGSKITSTRGPNGLSIARLICQVGMGVFAFGEPRGEKLRFSGATEFTSVGAGGIHARVVDGKGSCKVRLDHGSVGLVPIIDKRF